jgi:hypothetical protein
MTCHSKFDEHHDIPKNSFLGKKDICRRIAFLATEFSHSYHAALLLLRFYASTLSCPIVRKSAHNALTPRPELPCTGIVHGVNLEG